MTYYHKAFSAEYRSLQFVCYFTTNARVDFTHFASNKYEAFNSFLFLFILSLLYSHNGNKDFGKGNINVFQMYLFRVTICRQINYPQRCDLHILHTITPHYLSPGVQSSS